MKNELNYFLRRLFVFSAFVSVLVFGSSMLLKDDFPDTAWFLLMFFILATFLFHYGLLKASKGEPKKFVRYYMSATAIKLFTYLVFIIVYGIIKRKEALPMIISFMAFYFFFTVFEVATAMKSLKKFKE